MADWSWDVEVPSSLERLFLICLEDHCCDERWVPFKFTDLQRLTGMSQNRIKQAANTLWKMGYLEYAPSRGGKPQQFHVVPTGGLTSAQPPFPQVGFSYRQGDATITTGAVRRGEYHDMATELVKRWFATTTPRPTPAGGFPAAVKIVEKILSAGWEPHQTEAALLTVPTLSLASMEFALRRPNQQAGRIGQSVPHVSPAAPTPCANCGSTGWIQTQQGRRCVRCDEFLDV